MYLQSFVVRNFRRLRNAKIDLATDATVFVGANNSGKTSAMHIFEYFLAKVSELLDLRFQRRHCGRSSMTSTQPSRRRELPAITLDLWFRRAIEANLHRAIDLLPDLRMAGVDTSGHPTLIRGQGSGRVVRELLGNAKRAGNWPTNLHDYLRKRLSTEYHLRHYKLDHNQVNQQPNRPLERGREVLRSIIQVDLLRAQRHLADEEQRGRGEDLSRTLGRYYEHYLDKPEVAPEALQALADSEDTLNMHFAGVFDSVVGQLNKLGYSGPDQS